MTTRQATHPIGEQRTREGTRRRTHDERDPPKDETRRLPRTTGSEGRAPGGREINPGARVEIGGGEETSEGRTAVHAGTGTTNRKGTAQGAAATRGTTIGTAKGTGDGATSDRAEAEWTKVRKKQGSWWMG